MLSAGHCLHYSLLIWQCNNCRSFKGHNIMTDFPPLLVPGVEHATFTSCHEAGGWPLLGEAWNTPHPGEQECPPREALLCLLTSTLQAQGGWGTAGRWWRLQTEGSDPGRPGHLARPSLGLEDTHTCPQTKTLSVAVVASGTRNPGLWSPHH